MDTLFDTTTFRIASATGTTRDEVWRIVDQGTGYRADTTIVDAAGAYEAWATIEWDAQWLPLRARGRGRARDAERAVSVTPDGDHAIVRAVVGGTALPDRRVTFPAGCLVDLEPSVLPTWAMTRRYDFAKGGMQEFRWIGRSLHRDEVLEGGRVEMRHVGTADGRVNFRFVEYLPLPSGSTFSMEFAISNDERGRLQLFQVFGRSGTTTGRRLAVP